MTTQTLAQLHKRRREICDAITEIETMRRGSFNEFYYNQKRKDGTVARRGPFYNITFGGKGNKTETRSVPKEDVERVQQEVNNYHLFRSLTDEYIDICESISMLTQNEDDAKKN